MSPIICMGLRGSRYPWHIFKCSRVRNIERCNLNLLLVVATYHILGFTFIIRDLFIKRVNLILSRYYTHFTVIYNTYRCIHVQILHARSLKAYTAVVCKAAINLLNSWLSRMCGYIEVCPWVERRACSLGFCDYLIEGLLTVVVFEFLLLINTFLLGANMVGWRAVI